MRISLVIRRNYVYFIDTGVSRPRILNVRTSGIVRRMLMVRALFIKRAGTSRVRWHRIGSMGVRWRISAVGIGRGRSVSPRTGTIMTIGVVGMRWRIWRTLHLRRMHRSGTHCLRMAKDVLIGGRLAIYNLG